jgi:NTP pyrophosphatase (non-canonical NTP hydrolase)
MTFKEFQKLNETRCKALFHDHWPVENWALAIAGEAGELCNLVKKVIRGDFTLESKRQEILKEVADVMTYCDLLATELGADTGDEILKKFDEVSARYGYQR